MSITAATYTEGPEQYDGRRHIKEVHTASDGATYTFEYLAGSDVSPDLVLELRSAELSKKIEQRKAAETIVAGLVLPITPYEFKARMTGAERKAIRNRAKTNDDVFDFMDLLDTAQAVFPQHQDVQNALALLVHLGDLTPARAAVIGAE